jgi:hypothetical protein
MKLESHHAFEKNWALLVKGYEKFSFVHTPCNRHKIHYLIQITAPTTINICYFLVILLPVSELRGLGTALQAETSFF